jgi:hypothetical protein
MPFLEGVLLHFHIFYCSGALAMSHLSCRIIPLLEETQRCQLYHYDVVVIQLAALGFFKSV